MKKRSPVVKNWEGMNIVNNLMYYKEELLKEVDNERREVLKKRLDELKIDLEKWKRNQK